LLPAGTAVTASAAHFVGWHAITLLRVNIDRGNIVRVYFCNPNNNRAQVAQERRASVTAMIHRSWGADRFSLNALQAREGPHG
jgi:hypothetical protein